MENEIIKKLVDKYIEIHKAGEKLEEYDPLLKAQIALGVAKEEGVLKFIYLELANKEIKRYAYNLLSIISEIQDLILEAKNDEERSN